MAYNRQQLPLPPPPPPPPHHIPLHYFRRVRTVGARPFIQLPFHHAPEEEPSAVVLKVLTDSGKLPGDDADTLWFSCYNQTVSITQDGPTCGLVALMMALDTLGLTIPEIRDLLPAAKLLNYTRGGEMYSAFNLSHFVGYSNSEARGIHIKNLADRKQQIIEHLSRGWPVLIPYDSDRNHYPCESNGNSAHWAVIIGFCFELKKPKEMNLDKTLSLLRKDSSSDRLYHLNSPEDSHLMQDFFKMLLTNSSQLYLYAKQGKSSRVHLFEYDSLLKSNANLRIIAPNSTRDLLIPEGGVRAGLCDQAVLVQPRKAS